MGKLSTDQAVSIVAGTGQIKRYADILADVKNDDQYHSICSLVQPNDPEVKEVAQVLMQAPDFLTAAQEFVHSFTTYRLEVGDYWGPPAETLRNEAGDCDDLGILLCSLLRNGMPADKVYCAFGLWDYAGRTGGHLWVVVQDDSGEDKVIEATASPDFPGKGKYYLHGMFNDQYAFATDIGIKEFNLRPVPI